MTGVRFSLYPLREDFVPLILDAIEGLDRFGVTADTDDLSTLLLGEESALFEAIGASFGRVAASGAPVVLRAAFEAGDTEAGDTDESEAYTRAPRAADGLSARAEDREPDAHRLPERVNAQFSLYPSNKGVSHAAIERARQSGVTVVERRLCTHLYGRGVDVFDVLKAAFAALRAEAAYAVMSITVAANGPSSTSRAET